MWGDPYLSPSPKVNIIAWLEFELAYYNVAVQHISHYIISTASLKNTKTNKKICMDNNKMKQFINKLKQLFLALSYSNTLIENQINKVVTTPGEVYPKIKTKREAESYRPCNNI